MEPSGIRTSVRVRTGSSVLIDLRATLLLLALFSRQTIQRCPLRTHSSFPRTLRPSASASRFTTARGGHAWDSHPHLLEVFALDVPTFAFPGRADRLLSLSEDLS